MALWERLRAHLGTLRASREELEARDEATSATKRGTVPIKELQPRKRATVSGVLRAVTFRPAGDKPMFVGQLFDGSGTVDLVWIGRRSIAGIRPGTHLRAEGVVVAGRTRPTIYNPAYELLGA